MFSVKTSGDFRKTEAWLQKIKDGAIFDALSKYGEMGVSALASATPVESGQTAASWTYEIIKERGSYSIVWGNTNDVNGTPLAILLQYGHGTGTGGYVQGRDYINPALRPIFDQIAEEAWRVVTEA